MSLSEAGGYANQQMVTAESVGANTSTFLTSISSVPVTPCACESTQWGFWSAFNGLKDSSGNLVFEDQGALLLWVAGVPTTAGTFPCDRHGHLHRPRDRQYRQPEQHHKLSRRRARSRPRPTSEPAPGTVTITGLDGTNYAGTAMQTESTVAISTASLTGSNGGRTATLAGSFFQGGPTNTTPAYGEMGGSLILNGTTGNPATSEAGFSLARKP